MSGRAILGIDPGSVATGYGIVRPEGHRLHYVDAGVIRISGKVGFAQRLERIYSGLQDIIKKYGPTVSAVEDVFQAKNARSALKLGHARGATILAAIHGGLEVYEYSPSEIKKAVVGYGRADKAQVQRMVKLLLNLSKRPAQDTADALAVAICHYHANNIFSNRQIG